MPAVNPFIMASPASPMNPNGSTPSGDAGGASGILGSMPNRSLGDRSTAVSLAGLVAIAAAGIVLIHLAGFRGDLRVSAGR